MSTSETSKYRHLTAPFCENGCGIDIGSSGDPVVPHAIQIDLKEPYCPLLGVGPIHLRMEDRFKLPWFRDGVLDFCYSAHLIEDFYVQEWEMLLHEWDRVLKVGGHLIILAPEEKRWQAALVLGQPPNDAHKHEPREGELSLAVQLLFGNGYEVIMDVCPDPNDYGLVFVAKKC